MEDKNKGKKNGGLIGVLPAILFIVLVNLAGEDIGADALIPIIGILVFIGIAVAVAGIAKKSKAAASEEEHSHDRLHPVSVEPCSDRLTHYKKQLDSFLDNGIIERDEYRFLMNKYSRELDE